MVSYRRRARELALQLLFQREYSHTQTWQDALKYFSSKLELHAKTSQYTHELLEQITENEKEINKIIENTSHAWKIHRLPLVDLNILRISISEMYFSQEKIDPQVIIDEAVEISKKYGGEKTSQFVNGILGSLYEKGKSL